MAGGVQPFACRSTQNGLLRIGSISLDQIKVLQLLAEGNIAFVVIADFDEPLFTRHTCDPRTHLPIGQYFLDTTVAAKRVYARVARVLEDRQDTTVGEASPVQLSVPGAAVAPLRKLQLFLRKMLYDSVSRPGLPKRIEN